MQRANRGLKRSLPQLLDRKRRQRRIRCNQLKPIKLSLCRQQAIKSIAIPRTDRAASLSLGSLVQRLREVEISKGR